VFRLLMQAAAPMIGALLIVHLGATGTLEFLGVTALANLVLVGLLLARFRTAQPK
jgi:hypothetical protein